MSNEIRISERHASLLQKLADLFREKHRILVLGAPGVGKTTLVKSLTYGLTDSVVDQSRSALVRQHELSVGKNLVSLFDIPGGIGFEKTRQDAYRQLAGKKLGVINVVSFGYHETGESQHLPRFDDETVDDRFLKRMREVEVREVLDWPRELKVPGKLNWIMTVVTKADLWWSKNKEVIECYQNGVYSDAVFGAGCHHSFVVPCCNVFQKFHGRGKLDPQFDESKRQRLFEDLVGQLDAAIQYGSSAARF